MAAAANPQPENAFDEINNERTAMKDEIHRVSLQAKLRERNHPDFNCKTTDLPF